MAIELYNQMRIGSLNPVSLRFTDRNAERRFQRVHLPGSIPATRLALLMGSMLYALFGILDFYLMPASAREIWVIRFVIVIPTLFAVLAFTYNRYFVIYGQAALAFAMFVAGSGIIAMTALGEPPASQWYYAGLAVVIIYCAAAIRIHHLYSVGISVLFVGLYELSAVYLNPVPWEVLLNNNFFLCVSAAAGAVVSYVQEYYRRLNYSQNRIVVREKARAMRLNQELRREIGERLRTEDALRSAKLAAESANEAKSQFLANMSHELRTPLNAIIGYSEILREDAVTDRREEHVADLDRIIVAGRHLLTLIDEVLDLARIEAGRAELTIETFALPALVEEVAGTVRTMVEQNRSRLVVDCPDSVGTMTADATKVRQILSNLLSNAAKFTENGEVRLEVRRVHRSATVEPAGPGWMRFSVSDTGIGVPPERLERIFEAFERSDDERNAKYGGTGLGLAICRRFCAMMGGSITAESRPGAGTTFIVRLPAANGNGSRTAGQNPAGRRGRAVRPQPLRSGRGFSPSCRS